MPRSRSSSFESITRSTWCSLERKVPLCCSMASTSVVLPWSTCAMMAILRMLKLKVWFVLYSDRIDSRRTVHRRDAPSITLLCAEASQGITSHFGASRLRPIFRGYCDSKAKRRNGQPATAFSFGAGFPASRDSTSLTARCAARMPPLVVDSGPSESVFAKKTRSKCRRTSG
jgi:hypothetical protein